MERYIEGYQFAYCPKFDQSRKIRAKLFAYIATGFREMGWLYFDCSEQAQCEYFDNHRGCPFIDELLSRFSRS